MSNSINLNKVCFFIVTGASQGIGKTMSIECSKNFKPGSVVLLMARSIEGLESTKLKILEFNKNITVMTFSINLTSPSKDELNCIIQKSLENVDRSIFDLAFIIHNVGTIGDITKKASELDDLTMWQKYYSINVFTVAILNTQFMKAFENNKKFIVNITSKAAICPMKSFTLYCSGKAARELYFRVLAEEHPDDVIVLNYSPGLVETDIINDVVANTSDSDIKKFYETHRSENTMLTTFQTTAKFLQVILNGTFQSGDHIDYYSD